MVRTDETHITRNGCHRRSVIGLVKNPTLMLRLEENKAKRESISDRNMFKHSTALCMFVESNFLD